MEREPEGREGSPSLTQSLGARRSFSPSTWVHRGPTDPRGKGCGQSRARWSPEGLGRLGYRGRWAQQGSGVWWAAGQDTQAGSWPSPTFSVWFWPCCVDSTRVMEGRAEGEAGVPPPQAPPHPESIEGFRCTRRGPPASQERMGRAHTLALDLEGPPALGSGPRPSLTRSLVSPPAQTLRLWMVLMEQHTGACWPPARGGTRVKGRARFTTPGWGLDHLPHSEHGQLCMGMALGHPRASPGHRGTSGEERSGTWPRRGCPPRPPLHGVFKGKTMSTEAETGMRTLSGGEVQRLALRPHHHSVLLPQGDAGTQEAEPVGTWWWLENSGVHFWARCPSLWWQERGPLRRRGWDTGAAVDWGT